jgi:hypothetical protein
MIAPKRTDANQATIVQALRQVGAVVLDVHALPGCLDLLVAYRGALSLLEVKDGAKPAHARRLTEAEQETIRLLAAVGVEAQVVYDVESALRAVGAIL